ncbi:LuxR C-terminal-related transcriptional regulator [Sinimarinibacterium flocculans]|uniref:LuxR C-terminal-related transcriptional regulator n=1 Tax=Sinimarinibacterium flocculans TaxID=985250 RepID=UPI0024938799|nr:response regulator transcription factor [Sinimarinibacterium flocculans]
MESGHGVPAGPHGVFVLEDDASVRNRFRRLIEGTREFRLSGDADSLSAAAKQRSGARQASILLVDLRLPDGMGTHFIAEAAAWTPRPRIAVISALGDERSVITAIESGADGYVLKDLRETELVPLLESLLRGEAPISPGIARHLLKRFQAAPAATAAAPQLSVRETEVLELVAKGYANGEIARSLQVSESTVLTHVKHIYGKLDVHSRSQAVFEAAQLGLIRLGR